MKKIIYLIVGFFIFISVSGCSTKLYSDEDKQITSKNNGQSLFITSIPPIQQIAEEIVGDKYKVYSIVPENGSPEDYEITTQDLKNISTAKAYFVNGEFIFEKQYLKTIKENYPNLEIIQVNKNIRMRKIEDHISEDEDINQNKEHLGHQDEHNLNHNHGKYDPHYWLSLENIGIIATNITDYLITTDAKNKNFYKENLKTFIEKIKTNSQKIKNNFKNKNIITLYIYHPSIRYFANDYNLKVIAFQKKGKETSIKNIKTIFSKMNKKDSIIVGQHAPQSFIDFLQKEKKNLIRFNPIAKDIIKSLEELSENL